MCLEPAFRAALGWCREGTFPAWEGILPVLPQKSLLYSHLEFWRSTLKTSSGADSEAFSLGDIRAEFALASAESRVMAGANGLEPSTSSVSTYHGIELSTRLVPVSGQR
jgi:hypothetical protein